MKKIILPTLTATAIVTGFYAGAIFYEGSDLLLMPLVLILGLTAILGIVTIPILAFRTYKNQPKGKALIWVSGLALGIYLGLLVTQPLNNWDFEQRNLSGQLIIAELEKYRANNQEYPEYLTELNTELLNQQLPSNYQLKRFNYSRTNGNYHLDIPGLTLLHWNNETSSWEPQ
jgi:hypothetical protein